MKLGMTGIVVLSLDVCFPNYEKKEILNNYKHYRFMLTLLNVILNIIYFDQEATNKL